MELVESYDDLNLIVKKIKYKRGEIVERPNKYDFDFSEDYESNLETYCDELEKALDNACTRLESFDAMSYCQPEKHWRKEKWKEWCMKDE